MGGGNADGTASGRAPQMRPVLALSIPVAAILLGGSLSLPGAGSALAQSCSPSSAPRPTDGRVSGAWWSRYASWCSACGGTPYQNNSGGGCRPGPNWGGKAGGAAASSSGDAATDAGRIAADMFSRLNPQTNAQAGLAFGASIATGILSAGIAEMMKGPSPEQIRQRQIQEELARQESARLAREAAEAAARKHQALLSSLGIAGGSANLSLKLENDPNVVAIPDGAKFAGIPGNDELKLKLGDPQHLARGHRVVDCVQTRQVYERMNAGLPMQREQLAKYEEQIRNATRERPAISEEARTLAIKTAYDEARNIAKSVSVVRARIGAMKMDGVAPEKRTEWMRSLKDWDDLYEQIDKLPTAYLAGAQFGEDLPTLGQSLQERALRLNKLVVDSGLAETAGEELAKYGFGPAGAVTFRVAKFGIDSAYVTGKHILNENEIAQARATYDHLRSQHSDAQEKVNNAREDLAQLCTAKS